MFCKDKQNPTNHQAIKPFSKDFANSGTQLSDFETCMRQKGYNLNKKEQELVSNVMKTGRGNSSYGTIFSIFFDFLPK